MVTELCGFRKRASLYQLSNHLPTLPHPPHPAECSHTGTLGPVLRNLAAVAQGDPRAAQGWDLQTVSPRKALVWEPAGRVLSCVATL